MAISGNGLPHGQRRHVHTAPFYDLMNLEMIDTFIDTSPVLNVSNPDGIRRLPPSPEVDEAWEYLLFNFNAFV